MRAKEGKAATSEYHNTSATVHQGITWQTYAAPQLACLVKAGSKVAR